MRSAGRAQRDDGIIAAGIKGAQVLLSHFRRGGALAHHFQGQAAAGLLQGEVHSHIVRRQELGAGFKLLGVDEV